MLVNIFLFIITLCFKKTESSLYQNRVIKLDVFKTVDTCTDEAIKTNCYINTDNTRKTFIDANLTFTKNFTSKYLCEAIIKKCHKDMPDSCISFKTLKFPDVCLLLQVKNQLWSPITTKIKPKFKCPFTEGTYSLKQGYPDPTRLPFPIETDSYWKLNLNFIDKITKKEMLCFLIEGQLVPMKKES